MDGRALGGRGEPVADAAVAELGAGQALGVEPRRVAMQDEGEPVGTVAAIAPDAKLEADGDPW